MMKKLIRSIGFICLEIIVIAVCIFMGAYMSSRAQEKSPLTINKIALVNLDEGVSINKIQKYYAMEFIGTLKDNFEMTGLEHARLGLGNNLYAAYIIIPAAFSKNVESINNEPIKSNILFKINPDLDNTVRESVIADITDFNDGLGINMEYVYLDAILKEVHNVQDHSSGILENDKKDVQNILKFTKTGLIADPEYPKRQHMDDNIKELNLADTYNKLQSDLTGLSNSYKAESEKAQAAYDKMIASSSKMDEQLEKLNTGLTAFEGLQLDRDEETNNIKVVKAFADNCNSGFQKWKEDYNQQILDNYNGYIEYEYEEQLSDARGKIVENQKEYMKNHYKVLMRKRASNEVGINFEDKMTDDLYININSLKIDEYMSELCNQLKIIQNKNEGIKDQMQRNINEIRECISNNVAINENNIKALQDLANSLTSYNLDEDSQNDFYDAVKNDICEVAQMIEGKKNDKFMESARIWLCDDLVKYGGVEGDDTESIFLSLGENPEEEDISGVIETYYNPEITLPVPLLHPESVEEDATEENSSKAVIKNTAKEEKDKEEPAENTTETTENNVTGETTENTVEKVPRSKEQQSEIEKKLFQYTDDPEGIDVQSLSYEIEGKIIEPIVSTNCSNITASFHGMETLWANLNTGLSNFSIESYGNQKEKLKLETDIKETVNKIQTAVSEKGKEYTTYLNKANELNNKNLDLWEKSIKKANQDTHANIKKELSSIMENRQKINMENNELLKSVMAVLPYSRLGHLENREIYTYITNPLKYEDLSVQRSMQIQSDQGVDLKDDKIQKIILILLGIGICLAGGVLIMREVKHRNKSLDKQDLL